MNDKKTHGGKRKGAGRKPVDSDLAMKVGQACIKLEQQEYSNQKQALLVEQTNLQEFYDYTAATPKTEFFHGL